MIASDQCVGPDATGEHVVPPVSAIKVFVAAAGKYGVVPRPADQRIVATGTIYQYITAVCLYIVGASACCCPIHTIITRVDRVLAAASDDSIVAALAND